MRYPVARVVRPANSRHLLLCGILLCCAAVARADTNVRVVVDPPEPYQFLVSVSTHHADLHNGYSRTRFQELVPANKKHHVDTGFYVTLVHYSAWAYHPDFLMISVSNEGRFDALPDIEPETWRQLLHGVQTLPLTGHGPTYARATEHVRMYPQYYLPALDRAGVAPAPDALEQLQAFLARAEALAGLSGPLDEGQRRTALRLQDQAQRAMAELRLQLSLDRQQRIAVREFKALTAGPKPMVEALVREPGLATVADYLDRRQARDSGEPALDTPSWRGQHADVVFSWAPGSHYTLRSEQYPDPLSCNGGHAQFDGRHLADGLDPELVKSVAAAFCRHPDGVWRLSSRWAR